MKDRSEFVDPTNFSEGGVLEATFRFQVASSAFIRPARRPTRGSRRGAVVDTLLALVVDVDEDAQAPSDATLNASVEYPSMRVNEEKFFTGLFLLKVVR
jgi:hypothetical protein